MPVLSEAEGDGNLTLVQVLSLCNIVSQSLPSLDARLAHHIPVVRGAPRAMRVQIRSRRICRHPCRNDGLPAFIYRRAVSVGMPLGTRSVGAIKQHYEFI